MQSILFFGDSLTWGFDAKTGKRFPDDIRFTGIIREHFSEIRIIEEGLKGRTNSFDDSIEEWRNGYKALPMLLNSHDPLDLVVIMLGTNDCKRKFNCSAGEIAAALAKNIRIIRTPSFWDGEKVPDILIVCPPEISTDYKGTKMEEQFNKWSRKVSHKLPKEYQRIAKEYGCAYLDANEVTAVSSTDGVHLDEKGHKELADALEAKIRWILNIQ